jgi:transcriptional regulator GlxA family with amidase domain
MVKLATQQVLRLKDIYEYESLSEIAAIQIIHTGAARGGLARWQIYRVITHIEAHLAEPMRLRELAGVTRLSASHFSRAFKTTIGMTPCTFITRKRIARACTLMNTSGESLCQIAIACGLCDQAHLPYISADHGRDSPRMAKGQRGGAARALASSSAITQLG